MTDLEKPTIEEPIVEPVEGTEAKVSEPTDIDALVKELEKAGVTTTQELQGKLTASKEAGQLANLLGDANKRISDLEQARKQPPAEPDYDYSGGEPVDLESMMNNVLDKREAKTRQLQQQAMQVWGEIQSDEDFHLVKDVWTEKVKDPLFNMDIQTGRKNITKEYAKTVREYYKGIARQSLETITTLQKGGAPATPHVESEAHMPGMPTQTNETQETVTKLTEKVNKGQRLTEDDEMAGLNAILQGS